VIEAIDPLPGGFEDKAITFFLGADSLGTA
jgi:hypothetical protein